MQNINDVQEPKPDKFITAESLRELTLTPEQLFEIQKSNLCDTLMESMVGVATKNGDYSYTTNLLEAMSERLRNEIVEKFQELGYTVELSQKLQTEQQTQRGVQKIEYRILTINWKSDVNKVVNNKEA